MALRPEEAEKAVLREISAIVRNAAGILTDGQRRLGEIEREIENLMSCCASAGETSMKYINLRLAQLEKEKEILARCSRFPADFSASLQRLSALTDTEKKEAAALLIDRIEIRGRSLKIHWKPELSPED